MGDVFAEGIKQDRKWMKEHGGRGAPFVTKYTGKCHMLGSSERKGRKTFFVKCNTGKIAREMQRDLRARMPKGLRIRKMKSKLAFAVDITEKYAKKSGYGSGQYHEFEGRAFGTIISMHKPGFYGLVLDRRR